MTNCAGGPRYNTRMEVIYIDSLFFLNLAADYLLCLVSARVCGVVLKRIRYLLAALLGAVYAVAVFLPGLEFLGRAPVKLVIGIVMGLICFSPEQRPIRCCVVLLAVSAGFGGALWAISMSGGNVLANGYVPLSMKTLLLAFGLCSAVGSLIFRCKAAMADKKRLEVKVSLLGRSASFFALLDTGNALTDPLSGSPVLVASPHALKPIFIDNFALLELDPIELLELTQAVPGLAGRFRLIPYSAVGSSGMLPVFRPDTVLVDGREDKHLLIAVSKNAAGDGFEAII